MKQSFHFVNVILLFTDLVPLHLLGEHLLDAATEQINSLSDMPEKYRLADDPVLASWEIRFI